MLVCHFTNLRRFHACRQQISEKLSALIGANGDQEPAGGNRVTEYVAADLIKRFREYD
ncbi:hypothetical protein D3C74_486680 [compost metagenome]